MCGFGVKWWSIEGEKKKEVDLKHVFDSPRRPSLIATKLLLFASLFLPKANLASFKPLFTAPRHKSCEPPMDTVAWTGP